MARSYAQLVADAISKTSPKPGQDDAERISGRVFDRIEYDGTLIRQNIAEEIRQGLLVRDAEKAASGNAGDAASDLREMIVSAERVLSALEGQPAALSRIERSALQPLIDLQMLLYRLRSKWS